MLLARLAGRQKGRNYGTSALGQKRSLDPSRPNVRFAPIGDIASWVENSKYSLCPEVGFPMKCAKSLAVFAFCLTTTAAQAAGFRSIEVPAAANGPALSGAIWYPCAEPPREIELGPITIPGVKDCPIRGDRLPLVVISHGNLGAFFDHHDTAESLADAGFVVAAISHPGDTIPEGLDSSVMASAMVRRPDDIRRLISFMIGTSPAAASIDPERVGFFGFSAGAYTGLVLVGADPDWAVLCRQALATDACARARRQDFRPLPPAPEPRIKAAVLADPPGIYFTPDSFAAVRTRVQLWASETGGRGLPHIIVTPEGVAAIDRNLLEKHEYRVVPNTGHFAFLLCGPSIKAVPAFCADAPGFNRVAFHKRFNAEVLGFFRTQLGSR